MSLTTIIAFKGDFGTEFREILEPIRPRAKDFRTQGDLPAFNSSGYPMLAPYRIQAHEAATVGVAFDYLARFIIAKYTKIPMDLSALFFYQAFHYIEDQHRKTVTDRIKNHYVLMDKFFQETEISDEFIGHLCSIAKLEQIARQGVFDPDTDLPFILEKNPMSMVADIRKQGVVFKRVFIDSNLINPNSFIIYNPEYSTQVTNALRGIDADIYFDGVLLDFKSTKNFLYDKNHAYQLLGYYLFQLIDKALKKKTELSLENIEKLAFYKSRAGQIEYYPVKNFDKKAVFEALVKITELFKIKVKQDDLINVVSDMY